MKDLRIIALSLCLLTGAAASAAEDISLNGNWSYGFDRKYTAVGTVPGIHTPTDQAAPSTLWYKKEIRLPDGDWDSAVLILNGARFRPRVYVDGELVSTQEGGMIRSFHPLGTRATAPGRRITLEIALASLKDVPAEDASWIPKVDQWRSHCASALWDDVTLHLYKGAYTDRALVWYSHGNTQARLQFRIRGAGDYTARLRVLDGESEAATASVPAHPGENGAVLDCSALQEWSPASPKTYRLVIELLCKDGSVADVYSQTFALRDFRFADKQFSLNGDPIHFRGATVVWHRWMRDPEGLELGWDTDWIEKNIIRRLKDHGANYLRFHLGVPPERILDLCDRYGLAVQYEWNFFHGMPASYESLMDQYPKWFDMASRHPSVLLYHPYNETEGEEQLKTTWDALNAIVAGYPPVVLEDRDVIHIHKYWWSLFENLGLYYDSYEQFPKAIMVDEFGGNYLDGYGNMGLYPSIRESYMRFLGPSHDAQQRFKHLDRSCAKVAEYWRRIDAAGIAPFTLASSQEDGCNWFLGPLRNGNPKSVWDALSVLWSSRAVSPDIWDCNFRPGEKIIVPVHFFNDEPSPAKLHYSITVSNGDAIMFQTDGVHGCKAFSHDIKNVEIEMPQSPGDYMLRAELLNPPENVKRRVISDWEIRVVKAAANPTMQNVRIYIPRKERELRSFARNNALKRAGRIQKADVILLGRTSYERLGRLKEAVAAALEGGTSVIMLDVGGRHLGQGYPSDKTDLGPLQGVSKMNNVPSDTIPLFEGISLVCRHMAEPESHIHPRGSNTALWEGLNRHGTDLWNGMRGGLIVPADDMNLIGLNENAFMNQWVSRGADPNAIKKGRCFAYELCGFYAFSDSGNDKDLEKRLRDKVRLLIEDAPSLANSLNAKAPVRITDLGKGLLSASDGKATEFVPLCCAGKNLSRTPVILVGFGEGKGKLIVSQLLTQGRLKKKAGTVNLSKKHYGIRYDEAAVQVVLNMILASVE